MSDLTYELPSGGRLFSGVTFKVSPGEHVALIGANGVGKTTTLRVLAGELRPTGGAVSAGGAIAFMRQMLATTPEVTVRDLYLDLSPERYRTAAATLARAEQRMAGEPTADNGVRYANALAGWEQHGGYDLETLWAASADRAVGLSWSAVADRPVASFSGGEQKRLALELLFRSEHPIVLLDEPDNFLDIPAKRWLADQLNECRKTIVFVSHDRELLADAATKIVTIEAHGAWTHGGSFAGWAEARDERQARLDDEHRRWAEERKRLLTHMRTMKTRAAMSDANASRARAAETRLRHFDESGPPPELAREQRVDMQLTGGRSGKRVLMCEQLELVDLTFPFDLELWHGDRVAVVGLNGTGKSHFLRLLSGEDVAHEGEWRLGAQVRAGMFSQSHAHPEWQGRTPLAVLADRDVQRGRAMAMLSRYELQDQAEQRWETLSGGQQARLQILLLELSGANLLLLDEPTDNLDVASAEALEEGLAGFTGTVLAVSHDRWFLRSFDRFVVFGDDATVTDTDRYEV